MKRLQYKIVVPLLFIIFIGGIVFIANNRLKKPIVIVKERASEVVAKNPSLGTFPKTIQLTKLNSQFDVDFNIDSSTESASAADIQITYDPTILGVSNPVAYGAYFPVILKPAVIDHGTISLTLGRRPGEPKIGYGTMFSIKFTAIAYGNSIIGYKNTEVSALGKATNIIADISYSTVSIIAPTAIPTPTLTPTPAPTSTVLPTPTPLSSTILIYAAGTSCKNVFPSMDLILNSQVVASWTNINGNIKLRQFKEYKYTYKGTLLPNSVKIRFTNDKVSNTEDRNLLIDKIIINGTTYETESSSIYTTGSWGNGTGCKPGYKKMELLSCNGYFLYNNK